MSTIHPFAIAALGIGFRPHIAAGIGLVLVPPEVETIVAGGSGGGRSRLRRRGGTGGVTENVDLQQQFDEDVAEFIAVFMLFRSLA